jgi:hypothetical protein
MFPAGAQAGRLQKDRCDGDSGRRTIAAMDNATRSAAMGPLMAVISPGETAEVVERAGNEFLPARILSFGGGGKKLNEVARARCRLGGRRRWGGEETIL